MTEPRITDSTDETHPDCEVSHTHSCGTITFVCDQCERTVCDQYGADDPYYHLCDDCAVAQMATELS